jgi:hypothetical protein
MHHLGLMRLQVRNKKDKEQHYSSNTVTVSSIQTYIHTDIQTHTIIVSLTMDNTMVNSSMPCILPYLPRYVCSYAYLEAMKHGYVQ